MGGGDSGEFQLLLVQGMLPEIQVYCVFLPETSPDFKKQKEWCFIYFCILQQSLFNGFYVTVFVDSAFNHLGMSFLVTEMVTLNHYSLKE